MKIAFTGGGTGGHVFPAFAVIEELEKEGVCEFFWLGSPTGVEKAMVEERGIRFEPVPAGKLRRYFSWKNCSDIFRILGGFFASRRILGRERPDLLFSKGGYVSVPPVIAARSLGIPVFTHESDLDPGLATRLNARFVRKIFVAYENSLDYYPEAWKDKVEVSGNPVRSAVLEGDPARADSEFEIPEGRKVVFFLGGSLGAGQINELVQGIKDRLVKRCFIIHQTGPHHGECYDDQGYYAAPFFSENLPAILARADLVVSRAGAGSLWEIAVCGKPAILIPLGTGGSRGDQIRNAELFAEKGSVEVLDPETVTPEILYTRITKILDDTDYRKTLIENIRRQCPRDAARRIAQSIISEVEK